MHPILADRRRLLIYVSAWELLGALLASLLVLTGSFSWPEALALAVPLAALYAFVCLGAFWVCRAAPLRQSFVRVAVSQLAAAALSAATLLQAAQAWAGLLDRAGFFPQPLTRHAPIVAPLLLGMGIVLFLLAASLHYLLLAFEDSRRAETEALRFQVLSREAELRALRAQIHPHFLFNALNSINAMITARPEEARRLCLLLADFLRRSLTLGSRDRIPLSEELALAEDLLAIEQVRFGARLRVERQVEEAARGCLVPPLLLQPLVENAVTHGIAQCLEGGAVRIEAGVRAARLRLAIRNPRDPEAAARKGAGIGLQNVQRRLEALYGRDAGLRLRAEGESFSAELELPAVASS
jgi:hypothetical protein